MDAKLPQPKGLLIDSNNIDFFMSILVFLQIILIYMGELSFLHKNCYVGYGYKAQYLAIIAVIFLKVYAAVFLGNFPSLFVMGMMTKFSSQAIAIEWKLRSKSHDLSYLSMRH